MTAAARLRSLAPLLLERVKLLKNPDVSSQIDERTRHLASRVAGYHFRPAPASTDWRTRLTAAVGCDDNSTGINVVGPLCRGILLNKSSLDTLFRRKDFVLSHMANFGVDEVLLLCYTLAVHVTSYSTWFRVNCDTLRVMLLGCHRHLLQCVPGMSLAQIHCCLVIIESISPRYPAFGFANESFQRSVLKRLSELTGSDGALLSPGVTAKRVLTLEQSITKLPSKLQLVYHRIYPYVEAVSGRLSVSRGNTFHLVAAAAAMQRQFSGKDCFPASGYGALCLTLKRLMGSSDCFSLQSAVNLVNVLHFNSQLPLSDVGLDVEDLAVFAQKLKDLALDAYIVLPDSCLDPVLPDAADQCVTKLLSVCLEGACLGSLVACIESLKSSGHFNKHFLALFLPYIADNFPHGDCSVEDLVSLLPVLSDNGAAWFPFWLVYVSALSVPRIVRSLPRACGLASLCDFLAHGVNKLCMDLSGHYGHLAAACAASRDGLQPSCPGVHMLGKGDVASHGMDSDCMPRPSQECARWVCRLDDVLLLNVTDVDSADRTFTLPDLLDKRFGVSRINESLAFGMVDSLRHLRSVIGEAGGESRSSNRRAGSAFTQRTVQSAGAVGADSHPSQDAGAAPPTLLRSLESLDLSILLLERALGNLL